MNKKYRINSNFLETIDGKKVYRIASVQPDGIKILDESDNGTEIIRLVLWKDIK